MPGEERSRDSARPPSPNSGGSEGPRIVGLLGGIAGGKSFVARCFEELGAVRLDADAAGHEVLRLPEVEAAARQRWGEAIFGPDGRIVRSVLARLVFGQEERSRQDLAYLEQITHPRIGDLLWKRAAELAAAGQKKLILDAPVLLEAGWDTMCWKLLFVDCPYEQRLARALARGWSQEDFRLREAAQKPLDEKRSRADFVVDNSGSPEETKLQVARLWPTLFG